MTGTQTIKHYFIKHCFKSTVLESVSSEMVFGHFRSTFDVRGAFFAALKTSNLLCFFLSLNVIKNHFYPECSVSPSISYFRSAKLLRYIRAGHLNLDEPFLTTVPFQTLTHHPEQNIGMKRRLQRVGRLYKAAVGTSEAPTNRDSHGIQPHSAFPFLHRRIG